MTLARIDSASLRSLLDDQNLAPKKATGFASPADDYVEPPLDLNKLLVRNPNSTYFAQYSGDTLKDIGILDGALLVIDRSVTRLHGRLVAMFIDNELTCRIVDEKKRQLLSANPKYKAVDIGNDEEVVSEGVVRFVINNLVSL
jgi:DNA polymerase V